MTEQTILTLDRMAEALERVVWDWHGEMQREGLRELTPDKWLDLFRSHLILVNCRSI